MRSNIEIIKSHYVETEHGPVQVIEEAKLNGFTLTPKEILLIFGSVAQEKINGKPDRPLQDRVGHEPV